MEIKETKQKFIILSEEERNALKKVTDMLSKISQRLHSSEGMIEADNEIYNKDEIRYLFFKLFYLLDSEKIELIEKDA